MILVVWIISGEYNSLTKSFMAALTYKCMKNESIRTDSGLI